MAKYHYDITGAELILRDQPVYDASTLVDGEFVMGNGVTTTQAGLVTGYTGSAAEMVDGVGVMNETITTTSKADFGDHITTAATATTPAISSIAATVATGSRYGKVIINPFAVYLTEYSQAAADDIALTQAWSTTTLTLTNWEQDVSAGSWIYATDLSATTGFRGQLRYVASSGGDGSCVVLTAPTVAGAAADTIIHILPVNCRTTNLNAAALALKSQAAIGDGLSLCIMENYIGGSRPLEPMRQQVHDGLNLGNGSNTKFYADIIQINSMYNPLS